MQSTTTPTSSRDEASGASTSPTASPPRSLLISRQYALLWSGQAISSLGDAVFQTTIILWIATGIGRGLAWAPLAVSGVFLAGEIPHTPSAQGEKPRPARGRAWKRRQPIGHSWGANLALLYSATYPDHVERAALVAPGPLDDELGAVAAANLMRQLSPAERREHARLSELLERALAENELETVAELHLRRLTLDTRATFYSREKASEFIDDYRAANAHRKVNYRVNRLVLASYRKLPIWDRLDQVRATLLVLYGYQDCEPITQAYSLREHIPQTVIRFLNKCGHVPWLEQPGAFHRQLEDFLSVLSP